jgi:hypothetical protein
MDQPLRRNHFVFGKGKKRGSLQEKTTPYISYLYQEINKISIYWREHELMPKGEKSQAVW